MPVSATSPPSSGFSTGATFARRAPRVFPNMVNTNDNISTNTSIPSVLISHNASASSNTVGNNEGTAPSASTITSNTIRSPSDAPQQVTTHLNGKSCFDCQGVHPFHTCPKHRHLAFTSGTGTHTHHKHDNSHCSLQQAPDTDTSIKDIDNIQHHRTITALQRDHDLEYYDTDDDSNGSSCDLLNDSGTQSAVQPRITSLANRGDDERWVNLSARRLKPGKMGHLHSGSQFVGVQKGAASNYDVTVDIQHVDLENDVLCGYLHVTGLTTFPPKITTFFEGEIIGLKHSFLTRKWHADLSVDSKHWKRFSSFSRFADIFNDDTFTFDPTNQDFVYMRWKEKFLVPNHHVNSIDGASYAGFYYICYQRSTNTINGFYYCRNNIEWYQELILSHVPQRQFESFEFR